MHINLLSYIQTCNIHGHWKTDTYKLVLMHMWVQQHADKHCVKIMSDFGFLCYNWMKKVFAPKGKVYIQLIQDVSHHAFLFTPESLSQTSLFLLQNITRLFCSLVLTYMIKPPAPNFKIYQALSEGNKLISFTGPTGT